MKHPHCRRFSSAVIILFWLILWQTAAWLIDNDILLVGPLAVLGRLAALLRESGFWLSLGTSFVKISLGFLGAFILGILMGWLAFRFPLLRRKGR